MKIKAITTCLFISIVMIGFAQKKIILKVKQHPLLEAFAGKDTVVPINSNLNLGDAIVAKGGTGKYTYFWFPQTFLNNQYIDNPIATSISHEINYVLTVNDGVCRRNDTIRVSINNQSNIEDLESNKIKIYPIPTHKTLNIECVEKLNTTLLVQIFNLNGNIISTKEYLSNKIILNIEDLSKGHYILCIRFNQINNTFIISKE